ncbi:MAG: hypothetical protein ABIN67_03490 [Ferruginibacter sp.]
MPTPKIFKRIYKELRRHNDRESYDRPIPHHESEGNKSEKASVIINGFLGLLTLGAIYFSYQANQTSIKATQTAIETLNYAKAKDSSDAVDQLFKDSIDSSERVFNRRYIDSSLEVTKEFADAMTNQAKSSERNTIIAEQSLNDSRYYNTETKRQDSVKFETENRPYLQIGDFIITEPSTSLDSTIVNIEFRVVNFGKFPAKLLNFKIDHVYQPSDDIAFVDTFKMKTAKFNRLVLSNVSSGSAQNDITFSINAKDRQGLVTGYLKYFFFGEVSYSCPTTGRNYLFKFIYKINVLSGGDITALRNEDITIR